ncbi:hypothetical protein BDR26DRAFT_862657 [Obelidium mucronatum]|nr:hypothetical protein BDR26DRAFT_862657 [Obelidium mucronatum]
MRNVTPQVPSPTSTSASSIQKAAAALDAATSIWAKKDQFPHGNNVTSKRASFNGTASQAAHQPHTPKISSRRSSVASQRESTVREKFEDSLPTAASTESLSPKIAEAIETLRDTVLNKNPISPVFVPHVPASQQCTKCQKIVYAVEKIQYDDFLGNVACLENEFFCKFALKGNYNEGFGRADPKKDWAAHHPKA